VKRDCDRQLAAPASTIAEEAVDQLQASEKLIAGEWDTILSVFNVKPWSSFVVHKTIMSNNVYRMWGFNVEVSEVLQDNKTRPSLVEDANSTMGYF